MTPAHNPDLDPELAKLIAEQQADAENSPDEENVLKEPAPPETMRRRESHYEDPELMEEDGEQVIPRQITNNAMKTLLGRGNTVPGQHEHIDGSSLE